MKPIDGVYWPPELLEYVSGVSSATRRAASSSKSHLGGDVLVKQSDLQFCRQIQPIEKYNELRGLVAKLASLNTNCELYFRGQGATFGRDGKPGSAGHSLLPRIWRSVLAEDDMNSRLKTLQMNSKELASQCKSWNSEARIAELLAESPLARWAVLQHYEICDTPLLDLTRTLQIACSFAFADSISDASEGYVYVLGLPFQREKIMAVADEGILCMSLLGIMPTSAARPLVQDGYLTCDRNWWKMTPSEKSTCLRVASNATFPNELSPSSRSRTTATSGKAAP